MPTSSRFDYPKLDDLAKKYLADFQPAGITARTLHLTAENVAEFTSADLKAVAKHIEAKWESYERVAQLEAGAIHGAIEDELAKRNP